MLPRHRGKCQLCNCTDDENNNKHCICPEIVTEQKCDIFISVCGPSHQCLNTGEYEVRTTALSLSSSSDDNGGCGTEYVGVGGLEP